jgi:anti-sigma factor RsiW
MTCDDVERALKVGLDHATARDVQAHVAGCDRCAAAVVAWATSATSLPHPPIGFAHLTAVTARLAARPTARPRRALVISLVIAALASAALALWILNAGATSSVATTAALAGALIEAAALAGGLFIWLQSPPMRRRT